MTTQAAAPGGRPSAGTGREVPARAEGVQVLGEVQGSGYRRPPALARRQDGQVVQLTPLLHQVLVAVDGRRTVAEIAEAVSDSSGRLVAPDDVRQLLDSSLRPLGLLRRADGTEPELRRSDPLLALRFRRVVTDPAVTRRLTTPFAALFHPLVVVPVVLAFVAVAGWVLFSQGLAAATAQAFGNPALFLAVVGVTVLSAGFHEFGHAAGARYGGSTPGAMGFGIYLFWPAFYTDVTDSYRLGRAGRVRTDLGGLYFNALVVLASFLVWWVTGWHAVLLLVATQVLQMVRQLAPLLRFDGYHVLADLTGVPDLYQRIGPVLSGLVPGRSRPEATALKTWARVVVVTWVLVVVPLMAVSLVLIVWTLPRLLATAGASLTEHGQLLGAAFGDCDILGVLVRLLAIVAVVIPLLGIGYVLARLVRRTAAAVWRRTEDRPVRRGLVVVLVTLLVAGLGWAWWPDGDRYRPVRAWEGGTLLDAVPASAGTGLERGSLGETITTWPADSGPLPTADEPALALVLTPASEQSGTGTAGEDGEPTTGEEGAGATEPPTWVFPFDAPLPPGEGDNQALAVNTTDGSVAYDVSFALVWVEGDTAVNRNEAYALAGCRDCRTVAVAFQVVLLVGSVDVVVPENVAVAVNYACVECVTEALATQLVVTLPGELSQDGTDELAAIWAELETFGGQLEGLPLSELRDRLTAFEVRILDVVERDGADGSDPAGDGTTTGDTGTDVGTDDAGTDGEETVDPADGSEAAEPTTSAGPTGSTPTTSASTPSPTGSAPSTTAGPSSEASPSEAPESGSGAATSSATATPTG